MQLSTITYFITAMLAGHALAMPRGGGGGEDNNAAAAAGGNNAGAATGDDAEAASGATAAAGASFEGQACSARTGGLVRDGTCNAFGDCSIEIPPNEVSNVKSADCGGDP